MADEVIIGQAKDDQRLYTRVYHDFLTSNLLNSNQKLVYICLKKYLNVQRDSGEVYPTIEKIVNDSGLNRKTVMKAIKELESKGILKKQKRGLNKPNIYTLYDFACIWKSENIQESQTVEERIKVQMEKEHLESLGYIVTQKKEVAAETDQSTATTSHDFKLNNSYKNNTIDNDQSQYNNVFTRKMIDEIYDYHLLINDYQGQEDLIDGMLELILEVLNSQSKTTRIKKEEIPTELVKSRYLKLNYMHIKYVIDEVSKQTTEIKNKRAYLLTSLYNSYTTIDVHYANLINKN